MLRHYSFRRRESRARRKLLSSSAWIRWGALGAVLVGMLSLAVSYLFLMYYPELPTYFLAFALVQCFFILLGLRGFHALQKERYGRLGRAAFYTLVAAYMAQILGIAAIFVDQTIWWPAWIGYVGALVGYVLYGTATTRAGVLPRWCGEAFIIAYCAAVILPGYGNILFGLLWLALGYALWSRRNAVASEQHTRVR